jgi:hypothetical protein
MRNGIVGALLWGMCLAQALVSIEGWVEGTLVGLWAIDHDWREVGVYAGGEVPAHAKSSPIPVALAKHNEVWAAKAVV